MAINWAGICALFAFGMFFFFALFICACDEMRREREARDREFDRANKADNLATEYYHIVHNERASAKAAYDAAAQTITRQLERATADAAYWKAYSEVQREVAQLCRDYFVGWVRCNATLAEYNTTNVTLHQQLAQHRAELTKCNATIEDLQRRATAGVKLVDGSFWVEQATGCPVGAAVVERSYQAVRCKPLPDKTTMRVTFGAYCPDGYERGQGSFWNYECYKYN